MSKPSTNPTVGHVVTRNEAKYEFFSKCAPRKGWIVIEHTDYGYSIYRMSAKKVRELLQCKQEEDKA
jgi:hypothetical protein